MTYVFATIGATGEELNMYHTMYADDLMIFTKSMEVAQEMLGDVQATFASAGPRVNPDKCKYISKEGRHETHQLSPLDSELKLEGLVMEICEQLLFL